MPVWVGRSSPLHWYCLNLRTLRFFSNPICILSYHIVELILDAHTCRVLRVPHVKRECLLFCNHSLCELSYRCGIAHNTMYCASWFLFSNPLASVRFRLKTLCK